MNGTKKVKKVVCIGDSGTEGYGISEDSTAPYPAQLQRILGEGYQVINEGLSCTCTINRKKDGRTVGMPYVLQENWKRALEEKADIYVVMLGSNDAQNGYNEEENHPDEYNDVFAFRSCFTEDYKNLIGQLQKNAPNAVIFSVSPLPVMESIWRKHQQIYLLDILKQLYQIWADVPELVPVDVQKAFMNLDYAERKRLYQADNTHPSRLGAGLIAECIGNAILTSQER